MARKDFSAIAERRYRQYQQEQRKSSNKQKIVSFLFRIFQAIANVLQKAGIRRRKVETIMVEN